jgi:hypothetical protein
MLAWLNNLLGRAIRTCRRGCRGLPGAIRRALRRLFGAWSLARKGVLPVCSASLTCPALKFSIEHPAGKDRRCPVAAEGERQHRQ